MRPCKIAKRVGTKILHLRMGFFSWITADTGRSICNRYSRYRTFVVYMHGILLDGTRVRFCETSYEGYGDFGEKDYFVLLSEMNPGPDGRPVELSDEQHRERGVDLAHENIVLPWPVRYPQLTETEEAPTLLAFLVPCRDCPAQGYFYNKQENGREYFFFCWAQRRPAPDKGKGEQ